MTRSPLAGHAAMLTFSALVAGSFSLGSRTVGFIDPLALTAARFFLAGILVSAIAAYLHGFSRTWLLAPWRYAALGATMGLYFFLMFVALQTATPLSTSAVFTLAPLFSACFGYILMRQITTRWIAGALAIGAFGALWVIFRGSLLNLMSLDIGHGELIFVVGTASHALYAPLVPFLNRGEPIVVFTAGMLLAGTILLGALGAGDIASTDWLALPAHIWAIIAYLSVLTTAASFFLVQFAAMRLPSSKVMAYTYLTPSWVILWEVALGSGFPAATVAIGAGLTAIALLMLLRN